MGAGPLHLLKSGLAVRLEEEGHHVTIRSVELPPEFRATEIAATFELGAALARGVAEAVRLAPSHLFCPETVDRRPWAALAACKVRRRSSGSTLMAISIHRKPLGAVFWTVWLSPQ